MVSNINIERSPSYLQQQAREIILDARGQKRRFDRDDDEDMEGGAFWKFYREIISYLQEYSARENNDEINRLVARYIQYLHEMEEHPKSRSWLTRLLSSWLGFSYQRPDEKYIRIFQAICDNLGNLIYQVLSKALIANRKYGQHWRRFISRYFILLM